MTLKQANERIGYGVRVKGGSASVIGILLRVEKDGRTLYGVVSVRRPGRAYYDARFPLSDLVAG